MASNPDATEFSDTIVVCGDECSEDSLAESIGSMEEISSHVSNEEPRLNSPSPSNTVDSQSNTAAAASSAQLISPDTSDVSASISIATNAKEPTLSLPTPATESPPVVAFTPSESPAIDAATQSITDDQTQLETSDNGKSDRIDAISATQEGHESAEAQTVVGDSTAAAPLTSSPPSQPASDTAPAPAPAAPIVSLPASLPPKPVATQEPSHYVIQHASFLPELPSVQAAPGVSVPSPMAASAGSRNGAPGTKGTTTMASPPPYLAPGVGRRFGSTGRAETKQQTWDSFVKEEKKTTANVKWEDKFPEGSRIFIGNLSSERVTREEIFDIFHQFGRIAEIAQKSAFGFVQFHNADDAAAATRNAKGAVLGGRVIDVQLCRKQSRSGDGAAQGERKSGRAARADRYNGRESGRRRADEFRPRSVSPRRSEGRGGRDRRDRRGRSRSPQLSGRLNSRPENTYRQRSPSPSRRASEPSRMGSADVPRRHGLEVPDVQILVLHDLPRDFINWVRHSFDTRGLRVDIMFISPRISHEALTQQFVLEGVHGLIHLDYKSQQTSKLTIQVFDRATNPHNVLFHRYDDVTPDTAADLVLRERGRTAPSFAQPAPPVPSAPAPVSYRPQNDYYGNYGAQYPPNVPGAAYQQPYGHQQQYPQQYQGQQQYPPQAQPQYPQQPQQQYPAAYNVQNGVSAQQSGYPDAYQSLYRNHQATAQNGQAAAQAASSHQDVNSLLARIGAQQAQLGAPAVANPQTDITALLGSLQSSTRPSAAGNDGHANPTAMGDHNSQYHVQAILNNLHRR